MANIGTFLTVARTLSASLESSVLKEICSMQSCESQLEGLKETLFSLIEVLPNAEIEQELPPMTKEWIQLLNEVVYWTDDFFDEILTLAEQQPLKIGKLSEKVRDFFSPENIVNIMPLGVEDIRNTLDAMANSRSNISIKVDCQLIRGRRQENCSYAYVGNVIGMEDDLKCVIDRLLDSSPRDDVSFLTLVGVGGVGKTTLARLAYDDERVKTEFPLRLWLNLCAKNYNVKSVLAKIGGVSDMCDPDLIERRFLEKLGGKKYLLVLDDLRNEDHHRWTNLSKFLMQGGRGSRIVVTTRSKQAARVIGNEYTHDLVGLSPRNSWRLFTMAAFDEGQEEIAPPEIVEIGKKIVEKCANVPLIIKVVGSLLFGQDIGTWQSFQESVLADISEGESKNMSILKLSYRNLMSQVQSCFSYCALFPKGYIIDKKKLINLWRAQGYLVPVPHLGGRSTKDIGEEYFLILLRRCFLQDVSQDEYNEVVSCKIKNLIYDLAVDVATQDTCVMHTFPKKIRDDFRHLFYTGWNYTETSFTKLKIRSFLHTIQTRSFPIEKLVANWTCLRSLELHDLAIEMLPNSIGKLLHLRYLDLSNNKFKRLPYSFTKLLNLQTLNLSCCRVLRELPKDFCKLVNLRHLNLDECFLLSYMPSGMYKLTSLQVLTGFVVGKDSSREGESSRKSETSEDESGSDDEKSRDKLRVGNLDELEALSNLSYIKISILSFPTVNENDREGYLKNLDQLKALLIHFKVDFCEEDGGDYCEKRDAKHEALLEKLQPHPNIRKFSLCDYKGHIIRWGGAEDTWTTFLPNLVKIKLECRNLQHLPLLSKLQCLRFLRLSCPSMEYIENTRYTTCSYKEASEPVSRVAESTFFPSLQHLEIFYMPRLKGWREGEDMIDYQLAVNKSCRSSFPRLAELSITDCPRLISFPLCPSLEKLQLGVFNDKLNMFMGKDDTKFVSILSSFKLRKVHLDNLRFLKLLPTGSLNEICLRWDHELKSLSELSEVFKTCSALRSFDIWGCDNLKTLDGGLEHLTSLVSLSISYTKALTFGKEENDGMSWKPLHQRLRCLKFYWLDSMMFLPKGMQYLATLQHLDIIQCHGLKALPEWISYLSSLQSLNINGCAQFQTLPEALRDMTSLKSLEIKFCKEGIKERCRNPDGKDWPKIQYIPNCIIVEAEREPEYLTGPENSRIMRQQNRC